MRTRTASRFITGYGVFAHATGKHAIEVLHAAMKQLWVSRFGKDGIGGLLDTPGRGRGRRVRYARIQKLADRLNGKDKLTPRKLRSWIRSKLQATYSLCSVRRILRVLGFLAKHSTRVLVCSRP